MDAKEIEVSDDHILLSEIMEKHGYSVKQLASWSGRASQTIYKYMAGEATIPSVIWRALYERSLDPKIIRLITGTLPVIVVPMVPGVHKTDASKMACLIKARKIQLQCEEIALDIIADGVKDQHDRDQVEKYKDVFPESVIAGYQLFQAVTGGYEPPKKD
jgi:hypothetical protein